MSGSACQWDLGADPTAVDQPVRKTHLTRCSDSVLLCCSATLCEKDQQMFKASHTFAMFALRTAGSLTLFATENPGSFPKSATMCTQILVFASKMVFHSSSRRSLATCRTSWWWKKLVLWLATFPSMLSKKPLDIRFGRCKVAYGLCTSLPPKVYFWSVINYWSNIFRKQEGPHVTMVGEEALWSNYRLHWGDVILDRCLCATRRRGSERGRRPPRDITSNGFASNFTVRPWPSSSHHVCPVLHRWDPLEHLQSQYLWWDEIFCTDPSTCFGRQTVSRSSKSRNSCSVCVKQLRTFWSWSK